ncbi:MAG: ATP-binding protein [Pyrinomonadaceae bacterium]
MRRALFLIFKEAVNNAARHAQCERVEIELRADGPSLCLRVADDGRGFDPTMEGEGNGLLNMRRRARTRRHARSRVAVRAGNHRHAQRAKEIRDEG